MLKIEFLRSNFDEKQLRQKDDADNIFKNNLRCASQTQSYNVLDSQDYFDANFSLDRARQLLKNPFIFTE